MLLNKKAKFLMIRLSGLKEELVITRETAHYADQEFQKAFNEKYFPEKAKQNDSDKGLSTGDENEEKIKEAREQAQDQQEEPELPPAEETLSASKDVDPKIKKMFKSIAKEVHPDKLGNLSQEEKQKKKDMYQTARRALEEEDFASLYTICKELDLELPEIDEEGVAKIEKQIMSIKKEINRIKSTFMWQWLFAPSKQAKESLIEQLFNRMYPRS